MVLRRITEHVKSQNWFAVGLDFFIVVIGVFIGIQVSNWNEARLTRESETLVLTRLSADHTHISDQIAASIETYVGIFDALSRLMEDINAEGSLPDDPEQFELDLDLSAISVRRRNTAFMLDWLHGLLREVMEMQTKLESNP